MTALVIGSTGQVGSHLREQMPSATFWSRSDADLSRPDLVEPAIRSQSPSVIINAAAYTAVDQAEQEPDLAWRVNVESVAAIARAAQALDVPFIHLSTDYVFDGQSAQPYRVEGGTRPINVYGRSKLAAELAVTSLCKRFWILRTSWVFSEHGTNFVKTILRIGTERRRLTVVNNQHGRPTYAGDLATLIARLSSRVSSHSDFGLYHVCGGPEVTWYDFANEIFRIGAELGLVSDPPELEPVSSAEYPTFAMRPTNSSLEPSHGFLANLQMELNWQRGLESMLQRLSRTKADSG
jgi:dTDP-4-dehydrorhamnose reductase